MALDVRPNAIARTEDPQTLRIKAEQIRSGALYRYEQYFEVTGAQTPTVDQSGGTFLASDAAGVNYTLEASHPQGWFCHVIQLGAAQETMVAGTGSTVNTSGTVPQTRAQYSRIRAEVVSNTDGGSAVYVVSGDTS